MTTQELKALFDRLGPEWRVFIYDSPEDDEERMDISTPRIDVLSSWSVNGDDTRFTIEYPAPGLQILARADIYEPVVLESSDRGNLLQANRPDGGYMKFSTITLTPERLKYARAAL